MSLDGKTEFGVEEEDGWQAGLSDEERYEDFSDKNFYLIPKPDEIVRLCNLINDNGIVELEWRCPGRRSPSPPKEKVESRHDNATVTEENKQTTEFDFDDLLTETSSAKITPRRTPGNSKLKGSGQKRVASFKNVMSDIRRHVRLEQLDKAPSKSGSASRGRKTSVPADKGSKQATRGSTEQSDKLNATT